MLKSYFVYILRCSDDSLYTGVTNSLERRLEEHQSGLNKSCYTFDKRPVELVYYCEFEDIYYAINAEKQIKGWTRKKKEALISGDFELIHELTKCKNETSHLFKEH